MRLLRQAHDRSVSAPVNLRDLPRMEAAFATNTTIGVRAITAIDDITFPAVHEILDTLREEYEQIPAERP
jgi:branched-subunit amino acid aminotransferase/4-amino-4-deoxychorismate lyase